MTIGIVVFPGSNCDRDVAWATNGCLGLKTRYLWHESRDLSGLDAVVLPGGFSYGDYLRCGAIARFAPVLESIIQFSSDGGKILGICNGFQVLTELGLLPGALIRNKNLRFICKDVPLTVVSNRSDWFGNNYIGEKFTLPIAHGEGSYQCSPQTLEALRDTNSIALRYESNPNGSIDDIAAITNQKGNILGMMPHPERACDPQLGSISGELILKSLLS